MFCTRIRDYHSKRMFLSLRPREVQQAKISDAIGRNRPKAGRTFFNTARENIKETHNHSLNTSLRSIQLGPTKDHSLLMKRRQGEQGMSRSDLAYARVMPCHMITHPVLLWRQMPCYQEIEGKCDSSGSHLRHCTQNERISKALTQTHSTTIK